MEGLEYAPPKKNIFIHMLGINHLLDLNITAGTSLLDLPILFITQGNCGNSSGRVQTAAAARSRGYGASLLCFKGKSGLNSDLKLNRRCTGPFSSVECGCPGDVWTGSIVRRSQSPVMRIGCGQTRIEFTYMWTQPECAEGVSILFTLFIVTPLSYCWLTLLNQMNPPLDVF